MIILPHDSWILSFCSLGWTSDAAEVIAYKYKYKYK